MSLQRRKKPHSLERGSDAARCAMVNFKVVSVNIRRLQLKAMYFKYLGLILLWGLIVIDIESLEKNIPSGVVTSIDIKGDKILFDVSLEFTEPIKGEICIWLNPGLSLNEITTRSSYRISSEISKDPDIGAININKINLVIDQPVNSIRIVYQGLLKPLLMSVWGSHGNFHIARGETLWYPFTTSCQSILWGLLLCEHMISVMRFKLRGELSVASSIEYQGVEDGERVYVSRLKTGCLEFIAAPLKINSYDGEKIVDVYSLGEPIYSAKQIHDVIMEIENVFEELFGVKPPYSQYSIVFLEKTGGFKAGSLIVLDKDLVKTVNSLKANMVHELTHTWWGGFIKLCSLDTVWLMEAIPEYMTTIILNRLGIVKQQNYIGKLLEQAREISKQEGYKPPTNIWIPLTDIEDRSWRVVGEAILHEIAGEVGENKFNEIIGSHMKRSMAITRRYCMKWGELLNELKAASEKVVNILKIYRVISKST